jgi:hypothetical protein
VCRNTRIGTGDTRHRSSPKKECSLRHSMTRWRSGDPSVELWVRRAALHPGGLLDLLKGREDSRCEMSLMATKEEEIEAGGGG